MDKQQSQVDLANDMTLREALRHKDVVRNELIAGVTGFFAISYIIIVNPLILKDAGIPTDLSVFATIFSSVIGCLVMAFWANAPIILTPGMGVNAFFTYTIVVNMGLSWREALGIAAVASFVYMLIAFTKVSTILSEAIPESLKSGITAGIGLFLVEIGLEKAGLIVAGKTSSLVVLGDLTKPTPLLALFGLILSLILYIRKVKGNFFIAIIATSLVAFFFGIKDADTPSVDLARLGQYHEIVFKNDFSHWLSTPFILAAFSMTMILVFESMGLLQGLLPNQKKFKKTFEGSAVTTFLSGFLGTSPTVAAAESASGIETGGRTGIMALVAAVLFALSLVFVPLLAYVPSAAIAPVIIITGALMMAAIGNIKMADFSEWFPAFLIIVLIPFTNSISTGLAFGFVCYPVMKVALGKAKEMTWPVYLLGVLFLLDLVFSALL
ncbi:NCS2 family permease [Levilactobacillus parabrevis]|uniref:Xanthine uracil vitamin C permease n=1 Tax=Levilactobacillus parabrevis ATCC 53295 TaxID=1267003 RepID=A0A0R1GLJ9_9LACO|nr:NCS2 family permease [Levilactobacillus parabrevis]KRK34891.1 xanthine uracil vitamin C permease [Levilactobacillus parabrevis ATCC 53295]KRO05031.1 xanthine uracil vitamin C permease [Levilactobacillus parabrevis]MCT4486759.1 NCS2 family permease [Levilactobacillus parabrevis]MCT4489671.1 NCS2 family permease [Levilactobacillus parabrevis]